MHNSKDIKKNIGQRIAAARKGRFTRQELCDTVNALAVNDGREKTLNEATLKQWEYGNNQINIEWLPYLCAALHCDIGYIFGEYETETREKSDIAEATGLSFDAAALLLKFKCADDIITNRKKRLIQDLLSFRELGFLALVYEEYLDALSKYNTRNYEYKIHKEECENVEISKEGYYELLEGKLRDAELKLVLQLTACIRDAQRK